MYIQVIKSKIHRVTVTRANLDYIGSITVDRSLMKAAGLFEGEKVSVVNVSNGNRVETYVIPGEEGSGCIELNGAAAHLFSEGDIIIIMSYAIVTPEEAETLRPKVVFPDTRTNKLVK
ncbi:MAG TPA: aspartate 1-decarboxylase [Candidatus Coprenecus stercoravium]|uniref:Aspartate 1-decarboxylase n=1 Tax=Candidatus Coprenecus stercoravium TaxID=2840735 RepID=A0A9D2GQ26_9BACT|nr:aspartate 1-decarboxylase [Candidatus Coprenecus stercoravium]